jgi:3'(2'), 5'-bisphosphate nucleotidase
MRDDPAAMIAEVARLAELAGARTLDFFCSMLSIEQKADDSPVTAADRAAEDLILPGLVRLTPNIPIVAEEAVAAGLCPPVDERFWLVDALDGTKEFIARINDFSVNIALIEAGKPVAGVVHMPALGETYVASGPGKVFRSIKGGAPQPVAARSPAADGLVLLVSRSHANKPVLESFLHERIEQRGERIKEQREIGSSLKFCVIAAGEADLYPRLGPTMEWDTAAGHAVLAAAGGAVETLDGKPLHYGKPGFRNPSFLARGR